MQAVATGKRHPITYERLVIGALQHSVPLFGIDGIHTGYGSVILRGIAGYAVTAPNPRAILIQEYPLVSQIYLYVGIPKIRICLMAGGLFGVNRLILISAARLHGFLYLLQRRRLIDLPAITASADGNRTAEGTGKGAGRVICIVFLRYGLNPLFNGGHRQADLPGCI